MTPLAKDLLDWYARHARTMPWRDHPDPYAVWVSEIMLQQTRVETVRAYFVKWMDAFPTIAALAAAPQRDVLNLWEGLGYYSRARNLHKAAQIVARQHGARLPADVVALRKLPGIGPYTAGAIASIAFGMAEPVVDGNIKRVYARLFDVAIPIDSTIGKKLIWQIAAEQLPGARAGDYNQALMDLGATICIPKAPGCPNCPVRAHCQAHALGLQTQRPVRTPKAKTPHYVVAAAVIQQGDKFLIAQRPQDGLLGGMWEFPGGKLEADEDLPTCVRREILEELGVTITVGDILGVYKHAYTHFRVTLHAYCCELNPPRQSLFPLGVADFKWVVPSEFSAYPMGKIDRQISEQIVQNC